MEGSLYARARSVFAYLKPMNISVHSAYTSFFLVLSVFPSLMLLFAVLGYTSLGVEEVVALVRQVLPQPFMPLAQRLLDGAYENTSGTLLSVSAIAALWSASRGMLGLLRGLNCVYARQEQRSYWVTRLIGMVYTFLFVLVLVLTLVLHVFGTAVVDYLKMTTQPVLLVLLEIIDLRFVLLVVLQTALFTAMYAVLPDRRSTLAQSLPGALLASLGWMLFSYLFSLYVQYFPNYANVFGSVYAAALAMLWLYFCIQIIFYGGALNRYLVEKKGNIA